MDNHLAAGWCWLQQIDVTNQYNLVHIDRHYDLRSGQEAFWVEKLNSIGFDYKKASISDLTGVMYVRPDNPSSPEFPLFTWDNYLTVLDALYPGLWKQRTFATHKDGDLPDDYEYSEAGFEELYLYLQSWLNDKSYKTVVNLDIDYFFFDYGKRYFQAFSDDFIKVVAGQIKLGWDNIEVFTIALSPECCGGWDNAVRVARLITDELGIEWELI